MNLIYATTIFKPYTATQRFKLLLTKRINKKNETISPIRPKIWFQFVYVSPEIRNMDHEFITLSS